MDSNHRLGDYEPPALPLSYAASCSVVGSPLTESNRRPSPYHGDALPSELRGRLTCAFSSSPLGIGLAQRLHMLP